MNADFHGKTAVVAGGDPAGQAVALALAREGADVFVCGEHLGELETLAWKEALSIHTEKLPLTDDDALTAFVAAAGERMGAIHVMVCNGRSAPVRKPLTEVTPEEWSCAFAETLRTDWKNYVSSTFPSARNSLSGCTFAYSASASTMDLTICSPSFF